MRFFTREWINGELEDEAADTVVLAYRRHLEALGLPNTIKKLAELNSHDGYVLDVELEASENSLRIRLRCGDLQVGYFDAELTFKNVKMSPTDLSTLAQAQRSAGFEILYDEVDREAGAFMYRLLFQPAGEVSIRFSDVAIVRMPVTDRGCD